MPHKRSYKRKITKRITKRHDTGYKRLFSHPEFVRDLIVGFIPDPWLNSLDFNTLERCPGSYISDDLRERSDDIIWRIKTGDNWLYLYLLIEFQSTVDPYMAVRIFTYLGLLYQDLIRRKEILTPGYLPPVLPIVLYNGETKWNAAIDIAEHIAPLPDFLDKFRPHLRYLLIEELAYTDIELKALHNLTAAIFRLEKVPNLESVAEIIDTFNIWIYAPEQKELRRSIAIWVRDALAQNPNHALVLSQIDDLQEIRTMLSARMSIWAQNYRQEGIQQGELRERLRIARSLLDLIADDRLLAEKTGLSEIEVQELRLTTGNKQ